MFDIMFSWFYIIVQNHATLLTITFLKSTSYQKVAISCRTACYQHICNTSSSSFRCDWYMSDCTGLLNLRIMQVINRKRVLQPWWFSALCLEGVPSPFLSISVLRFHSYPHCAFLFRNLSLFAMSARRRARTLNQGVMVIGGRKSYGSFCLEL